MGVTIRDLPPQDVARQIVTLRAVYEAMYGIPAGKRAGFEPVLIEHSQREGFRLCTAIDQESEQVIGFGYGFTGLPGQPWRDSLAKVVGIEMAAEWLTGHFEFAEFGMIPTKRRFGIGTQLYQALFKGLPHERAILTVREENNPARRFYDKQGWTVLYEGFFTKKSSSNVFCGRRKKC